MKTSTIIAPQPEFWQTIYQWLIKTGNKLNKNYCKEEIATHPDYPSLVSMTDFLDSGNMIYKVIQADYSYIEKFNYPLLAHIKQHGYQYVHIIRDRADWVNQKEISEHWTGVVIYPDKNSKWENANHTSYQRNAIRGRTIALALAISGLALLFISTFQLTNLTNYPFLRVGAFGLLSFTGIILSLAALGTELGFQNESLKQVCGAARGGCENVVKSRFSKGFAGLSPADGSVLYFTTQFIIYLVGCWYLPFLNCIFIYALGSIAIAIWSVYTQAIKLKEWCAICLAIVSILLLQCFIAVVERPVLPGIFPEVTFITLFIFLTLILLAIKQLITTNINNKLKLAELKKWKLDADLFLTLWQQEQKINTDIWTNDLLLGNLLAQLQITVACNPYCNPCADAHIKLDNLLHRFPDVLKIQIRLVINPNDTTNKTTKAVKVILQKSTEINSNKELQQMLTDWFNWMNLEKWVKKWRPDETIAIEHHMQQHTHWIDQSKIAFTPTFFFNGKKLPGRYSIDDLEILIPQLLDLMKAEQLNE